MPARPRLFILDANALLHRAWHALPPLTAPDGTVVNAVYGVLSVLLKLIKEQVPDAFVACWDTKADTFRHGVYAEYKATREKQPDELYAQIPLLKDGLSLLGIDSLEKDGFEADDLLGTIAYRAKKKGWDVTIVTGDRDALQLVQPSISVLAFKKGVTDTVVYDEDEVKKQYGLTPKQFLEYKAMRGDPSDNIPGIRGIGEKGATELLQTYGSLKDILKAAHNASSKLSPSTREKLLAAEKSVPDILKLVTIVTDAPVPYEPKKGSARIADEEALRSFLLKLGFASLVKRLSPTTDKGMAMKEAGRKRAKKEQAKSGSSTLIETKEGSEALVKELAAAHEFVLHVARGAQHSLFGSQVDGIVFVVNGRALFLPSTAMEKSASAKKQLQAILLDPAVKKIAHDAKAQLVGLEQLGCGTVAGWSFDTMLAAYVLGAGERNHDLTTVAHQYADVTLPAGATPAQEAEAVAASAVALRKALEAEGLMAILERFELPLVPVLRDMERAGILIDKPYLESLAKEMRKEKEALEKKMMKAAGREFNPGSPSQLADVLFVDLKLETKGIKRGKTGFSTAAPELEKLRGSHPIIEMVEEQRELAKLLSTYVEVLPNLADKDGRVHTTFNQAVAATGRLSSSEPNLQNIPIRTEVGRKIRRAFLAPKGSKLLSCDYSQIELRLVAALAKDKAMLEAFRHGEDIHTATAAAIWGVAKDEVTKDQRRAAKAINFGIIYGQGPLGLSQSAGISFADAKKFIAAYFDVYKGIKDYMDQTKALAMKVGYVETLFGRRRPLPEIHSMLQQVRAQAERMAINMPVQGTAADLMKRAMIELAERLPAISKHARILLQVHDELVLEVPDAEVKKVAAAVKEVMEQVEKVGVPIVVEAKVGQNWEEMRGM